MLQGGSGEVTYHLDGLPDFWIGEAAIRKCVTSRVPVLLGFIYSWGGRSTFSIDTQESQFSGVDCSGFVSLLYRSCGVVVPRDASKQALVTQNVTTDRLKPGDVFFFGVAGTQHFVGHVLLYFSASPDQIAESAYNATRILSIERSFGQKLKLLRWGQKLPQGSMNPGQYITWGSFF